MARIIPFRRDEHREAQLLLPWNAKGRLEDDDRARVEAHLATCAECAAELALEQALAAELAELPLEADLGWARLRERMAAAPPLRRGRPQARRRNLATWGAGAAGICVGALLGVITLRSLEA